MHPNEREQLQASLFKATSAFDAPEVNVQLTEQAASLFEVNQSITISSSEKFSKIASLLEEALECEGSAEGILAIEEALELARKHA